MEDEQAQTWTSCCHSWPGGFVRMAIFIGQVLRFSWAVGIAQPVDALCRVDGDAFSFGFGDFKNANESISDYRRFPPEFNHFSSTHDFTNYPWDAR